MARKRAKNLNPPARSWLQQPPAATSNALSFQPSTLAGMSVILAAVTLFLYFPISSHPFVNFDDGPYITDNPHIQNGLNFETIRWAATAIYAGNWHPFTWLVHAFDFGLYGPTPGGHHVTSLLFHIANSVLLFLLLAVVTRSTGKAFLVGALFALHPLNVESVAWAAELKNVLCTFFFLLTLGAYAWYARKPGFLRYLLIAVLFVLGLASKPMIVTLPCDLLILDFWPLCRIQGLSEPSSAFVVPQRSILTLLLEKAPLFAISAASSWITVYAQRTESATERIDVPLSIHLANVVVSYATYFLQTSFPFGLAPYIPFPTHGIPLSKLIVLIALLLLVTGFVLRHARKMPYLLSGWAFFLGTLVPVIGIIQVGSQARADRYMYIPIIGLLCPIIWGFSDLADAKSIPFRARVIASAAVLISFYALSVRQISFWDSSYDMWMRSIAVEDSSTAERNLSVAILIRSGPTQESFVHARRAVELDPDDLPSRMNLGDAYLSQGNKQEALNQFKVVLEKAKDPQLLFAASLYSGSSYAVLGNLAKAEEAYRSALRIFPDNREAMRALTAVEKQRALSPAASSN